MGKLQQFREGYKLTPEEQEQEHRDKEGEKIGYLRIGQRNRQEKIPTTLDRFVRGWRKMFTDTFTQ